MCRSLSPLILTLLLAVPAWADDRATVIWNGHAHPVAAFVDADANLWLPVADLKKATGFELKPQGICDKDRCIPVPAGREAEFIDKRPEGVWFNLSALARLLKAPLAFEAKHKVWCVGAEPETQNGWLASRLAPDFTLNDKDGKPHKLSDFRGKKVLLITWASW